MEATVGPYSEKESFLAAPVAFERAILITVLRRLVDFDPQPLSPQIQALKAILERLEPQKPHPIPETASTR